MITLLSAVALLVQPAPPQDATPPSPKEVDKAIDAGADYLLKALERDAGSDCFRGDELLLYALYHAGRIGDARANAALQNLLKKGLDESIYTTYHVSLRAILLEALDGQKYQAEIARCAWWLVNAQTDNGQWDYYGPGTKTPDRFAPVKWPGRVATGVTEKPRAALKVERVEKWGTIPAKAPPGKIYRNTSTMQYALLGLYSAHKAYVVIPPETWERALKVILKSQDATGGWGYIDAADKTNAWQPRSYVLPGMTAGNLAALSILKHAAESVDADFMKAVDRGFASLGQRLELQIPKPDAKPGPEALTQLYHYYFLFSVERAGILWERERIGGTPWYAVGARQLLLAQQKDGSWGQDYANGITDRSVNTSFAVLFLKRAVPPPVETGSGASEKK